MEKKDEPWYAVRCLFSHPSMANEGDGNLYEERITLWKCETWDEAFALAEKEALEYSKKTGSTFIDSTDSFHLFETSIKQGSEVWSLMRGSLLSPELYTETFCATEKDRSHQRA